MRFTVRTPHQFTSDNSICEVSRTLAPLYTIIISNIHVMNQGCFDEVSFDASYRDPRKKSDKELANAIREAISTRMSMDLISIVGIEDSAYPLRPRLR